MFLPLFVVIGLLQGQLFQGTLRLQARNTIEGRVTTADNRPLERVPVLLLTGGYTQLAQVYTNSIGQFRFTNLGAGEYYVQVEPAGMDYERQTQRIEVNPISQRSGSGEIFRIDIILTSRGSANSSNRNARNKSGGVVFFQDVPEKAKKEYEKGVKNLEKNEFPKASESLKSALEIFPDYYDALELLGTEYVKRKEYESSLPLLTRAIEVNKDGWRSHYSLGVALIELKQPNEAIKALRRAVELNPESANTNMRLGMALAQSESTQPEAIEFLKKVTQLAGKDIPDAYLYLATLYSKTNQYKEAADALETYLQAIPQTEGQGGQREKLKVLIGQLRQKASQKK
jgi:tetratricopeptide (TPR) repeat protein